MREFTQAQKDALDALEGEFGPVDPYLHNVKSDEHVKSEYGYVHWIERSLRDALRSWGQYKYALSVDWEEAERKRREAEAKARAENLSVTRDTVMLGFMSGLIPGLNRIKRSHEWVDFTAGSKYIELELLSYEGAYISMTYDKQEHTLKTVANGLAHEDDCTAISGQDRPGEQMEGFAVVLGLIANRV